MAKDLQEIYNDILGSEGDSSLTGVVDSDSETSKEKPAAAGGKKKDSAYTPPDYEATGAEAKDPRDESTLKKTSEEPDKTELEEDEVEDEVEVEISETDETPDKDVDEEFEIPEDLVAAARRRGISDDKIVALAEEHMEVLEAFAADDEKPSVKPEKKPAQEEQKQKPKYEPIEKIDVGVDALDADEDTKEAFEKLQKSYNTAIDKINALQESQAAIDTNVSSMATAHKADVNRRIDNFFDIAAKENPAVGNSKKGLSKSESKSRVTAARIAYTAQQVNPDMTDEEALGMGLAALGATASKSNKDRILIDKLTKRRKLFSPKPTGRKKSAPKITEEQRGIDIVRKHLRTASEA